MKTYDVAVLYTDGSHIPKPEGSGAGIHAYLYNLADVPDIERGYVVDGIPEAIGKKGYFKFTEATKPPMLEDVSKVAFWDCILPCPPTSAQVGELSAFIGCFDSAPFKAKQYYIQADSEYMINTVTKWIFGWHKRGWILADGTPTKNVEYLTKMLDILNDLKKRSVGLELIKIKAHAGHYGNEMADELAKKAAAAKDGANVQFKPYWVETEMKVSVDSSEQFSELHDIEILPGADIDITGMPAISSQRLHYVLTNEPAPMMEINGKSLYYMLSGNHAKDKDDLVLVGKYLPDAMYSVVASERPWENVKFIADLHYKLAWGDSPAMKRYEAITLINGDYLKRKKFVEAAKSGMPVHEMTLSEDGNSWLYEDMVISHVIRPPLLSYRALEFRNELAVLLKDAVEQKKPYVALTDITDMLFDENGKPRKDFYRNVDRSFKVKVNVPMSKDKQVDVILSRGIDIMPRSDLNRIKEAEGRFYVAAFRKGQHLMWYSVVYIGQEYNGLWMGYHSARRILTTEQI